MAKKPKDDQCVAGLKEAIEKSILPLLSPKIQSMATGPVGEDEQLTLWPDWPALARVMPNHLARSTLFAPIKRGPRKVYDREKLASRGDVQIYYTGRQLDMADQDLFLQILQLFRDKGKERSVKVNRADILRNLNRSNGKSNYTWLEDSMHRLKANALTVKSNRYTVEISLVEKWAKDDETGMYLIGVDPEIRELLSNEEFGYVNWERRMALGKKIDLAKWLQTYFSASKKGPQTHKISTIKELCGSASRTNDFMDDVEEAARELARVGEISKFKIDKKSQTIYFSKN